MVDIIPAPCSGNRHRKFSNTTVKSGSGMVAIHCLYHGFGPHPTVALDVFRVDGNRITEHWDALAPLPAGTEGARRIDGPTEVTDRDRTDANKTLVTEWVQHRLIGADRQAFEELAGDPDYAEHGSILHDRLTRQVLHRVIGEGNFVLTLTEASLDPSNSGGEDGGPGPAGCYELWRVAEGRIIEHWEVVPAVPETLPHGNGFF